MLSNSLVITSLIPHSYLFSTVIHASCTAASSGILGSQIFHFVAIFWQPYLSFCSYILAGGEFGTVVQVHIQNDGPTTLQFETPNIPTKSKEVRFVFFLSILRHYYYCHNLQRKPQNASKKGAESTKKETPAAVSGVESEKEETAIASAAAASSGDN